MDLRQKCLVFRTSNLSQHEQHEQVVQIKTVKVMEDVARVTNLTLLLSINFDVVLVIYISLGAKSPMGLGADRLIV